MPAGRRREMILALRELVAAAGMTFACCREGLADLNTAHCDGRSMLGAELGTGADPAKHCGSRGAWDVSGT